MFAKRVTRAFGLLAILAMLLVPVSAFAAGPAQVSAHEGHEEERLVGCYHYLFTTYDNGMNGKWAVDNFDSTVCIYRLGDFKYRVVFIDGGTFITLAAKSPGGDGTTMLAAGIQGTIAGGETLIVKGALKHHIPSEIGPIDFRGDAHPNYLAPFFWFILDKKYEGWGWVYTTKCNGTWVDNEASEEAYSEEGPNALMGDVKGELRACEKPAMPLVVKGLYAFINPGVDKNICYILSFGVPSTNPETGAIKRLCFTESSPDWYKGAVLLTFGGVYDNGTAWGVWEGDAVANAYNPHSKRLPLFADGPNNDLRDKADMFPWTQQ